MKKSLYIGSVLLIIWITGIFIFLLRNSFFSEKFYIVEQKVIPILYPHPKDRVYAYIHNANTLFTFAQKKSNNQKSLNLAYRAEHSMTRTVEEIQKLSDSGIISFKLIRDTYDRHQTILKHFIENTNGSIQNQFINLLSISIQNEKTTKTLFYNRIPAFTTVIF